MKIILLGDSSVAEQQEGSSSIEWEAELERQLAQLQLDYSVVNFAKQGASVKEFEEEGLFRTALGQVSAGDYVLIHFGRNDPKGSDIRRLNDSSFYLENWLHQLKQKEAQVILCTPAERWNFIEGRQVKTLSEYQQVIKRVAKNAKIAIIDLTEYTLFLYGSFGERKSRELFRYQEVADTLYPVAALKNACFSKKGAQEIARYVALRLVDKLGNRRVFDKYYYGACMYPEVWDEEIFRKDVLHMKELKMNFARIGEFVWKSLEPSEGRYDFSLLEKSLEIYQEAGIDVCLCIPTPTPPHWLTINHPERLIHQADGKVMAHGSRQHVCTNNPYFREKAYALTEKIAELSTKYSNVVAIQLDNEFKCHVDQCYCMSCEEKWHEWLRSEYLEIENLNASWGTTIWSEEYPSFEEVSMPLPTPFLHNASLQNAFRRFTAESLNEFAHGLCHHIRMKTTLPITHNTALGFHLINNELFSELDVAGFDTYTPATMYWGYLLNLDIWRNIKPKNGEMLLLETSTSHAGHLENYVEAHPRGYLQMEVFTGFASGLKAFDYWHFRRHRFGVEQPHSCVLTAWGEPDRGYDDVVESGKLIAQLTPLLEQSTYQSAQIGMIYSDQSKRHYAIETGGIYDYRTLVTEYHGSLLQAGVAVELIPEEADFEKYRVLLVPFLRSVDKAMLEKFTAFTQSGGKLILGPMTGDRTNELTWPETNGLGLLGEWLGLNRITQYKNTNDSLIYHDIKEPLAGLLTVFTPEIEWNVLGRTTASEIIFAKKNVGVGEVFYLGGLPKNLRTSTLWQAIIQSEILPFSATYPFIRVGNGIVNYVRETQEDVYFYVANMTAQAQTFELLVSATEHLRKIPYQVGIHKLTKFSFLILKISK
ncbi:MAG: beta-galactosidase [Enterococcus sp.]